MRFWTFLLLALTLAAQTPSFEVASIRPSNSTITIRPLCSGSIFAKSESVLSPESSSGVYTIADLIRESYYDEADDFDYSQWTRLDPFAVSVKIPPNTSVGACRKMLQTLLAERFHTVTGIETRDIVRYFLKVAKSGLKMKPVGNSPADASDRVKFEVKDGVSHYAYRGAPMSEVVNSLVLPAAVSIKLAVVNSIVDDTSLTGYYDGEFQFSPLAYLRNELAESLNDALTRQLGLTLELRKAPGKVLVLRSSDRMPTEN